MKISKFPKTKKFKEHNKMSIAETKDYVDSLYSEPEFGSMVDSEAGTDDLMSTVLDFFEHKEMDSDSIGEVSTSEMEVDNDGYIRGKICIWEESDDTSYIHFIGYLTKGPNGDLSPYIGFKEISWFYRD